jgi:short-subunit dehydrogenase
VSWAGAAVVVTGASRGIGRAVVDAALERGARVGAISRSAVSVPSVAWRAADVGDRAQVESALAGLAEELGPVDVLVANAGIGAYGPFVDADVAEIERLVQVNVLGTVYPVKAVLPGMLERRRGHIVIVSSVAGRFGSPFEAAYSATKFAQVGLAEALSVEVSSSGVGVSVVDPAVVDTAFFEARGHAYDRPFPRPMPAGRVADAVIAAVERGRLETFVPRAFGAAVAVRHLSPRLYAWGTRRTFRRELGAGRPG